MKAYAIMKNISGRRGTSNAAWEAYRQYGMETSHGLPASGKRMLNLPQGDKDGEKARERFHHLLLDSLKKDRETATKDGLASAAQKGKRAATDSDDDAGPSRPNATMPTEAIRVVLIDPDILSEMHGPSGQFKWATAAAKRLVALKETTVAALTGSIEGRIPAGRYVRVIYGALTKPPADGGPPDDIERITCDEDLLNFFEATRGAYKPVMFQLQLKRADPATESPPLMNVGTSARMSSLPRSLRSPTTLWRLIRIMNFT